MQPELQRAMCTAVRSVEYSNNMNLTFDVALCMSYQYSLEIHHWGHLHCIDMIICQCEATRINTRLFLLAALYQEGRFH